MPFPLIPVLALLGIAGGVTALVWYSDQTREDRERADTMALQWFGRRFKQLAKYQQDQIREQIS